MGYNALDVINDLALRDGARLGDYKTLLTKISANAASFAGPFNYGTSTEGNVYPGKIASVLFVGVNAENINAPAEPMRPMLFDVDPRTFMVITGNAARVGSYSNSSPKYFSEVNPVSAFANSIMPSTAVKYSELKSMNPSLANAGDNNRNRIPYSAGSWEKSSLYYPEDDFSSAEQAYAGYAPYTGGTSSLAALFYLTDVIDELQARYGYRVPDPTRAYSPYNWVGLSETAGIDTSVRYYRVLYLTEFDLYAHMGMIATPSVLTTSFVSSPAFADMITAMVSFSKNATLVKEPSKNNTRAYLDHTHSSMLKQGDILIPGQYIYSKDFRYKLHLRHISDLSVHVLPINGSTITPFLNVMGPASITRMKNRPFSCMLSLQSDKNIVLYPNPIYSINYGGSPAPAISLTNDAAAIGHTATYNNGLAGLTSDYKLLVAPYGAVLMASGGSDSASSTVKWTPGFDNTLNSMTTTDALELSCINGWTKSGATVAAIDGSPSICYTSALIRPSDFVDGAMRFEDTELQSIFYRKASATTPSEPVYDAIYTLMTGSFMGAAVALGFKSDTALINKVKFGYCMRGNRMMTAAACSSALAAGTFSGSNITALGYKLKALTGDGATYTIEQLNTLFEAFKRSETGITLKRWQSLYAAATYATELPVVDFSLAVNYSPYAAIYNHTLIKSAPSVYVFLKTTAGFCIISGEMSFPYEASPATAFSSNDIFWKRLMISGTIAPESKWAGPSFMPIDVVPTNDLPALLKGALSIYGTAKIAITGLATAANAMVYFKTTTIASIVDYVRSNTTGLTLSSPICQTFPDVCYPQVLNYVTTNKFDTVSNSWCDIADAVQTGTDKSKYFSQTNKANVLTACKNAAMVEYCAKSDNRYKTGFANGGWMEGFSVSNCADLCSDPNVSGAQLAACKTGSVEYCKLGSNAVSPSCLTEAAKYPEVDLILQAYCITNPTNAVCKALSDAKAAKLQKEADDALALIAQNKADEDAAAKKKKDDDDAAAKKKKDDDDAAAKKKKDDDDAAAKKKKDDDDAAAKKKADDDAAAKKKADGIFLGMSQTTLIIIGSVIGFVLIMAIIAGVVLRRRNSAAGDNYRTPHSYRSAPKKNPFMRYKRNRF